MFLGKNFCVKSHGNLNQRKKRRIGLLSLRRCFSKLHRISIVKNAFGKSVRINR